MINISFGNLRLSKKLLDLGKKCIIPGVNFDWVLRPFSNQNLSPRLAALNWLAMIQAKVGPSIPPGTFCSRMAAT